MDKTPDDDPDPVNPTSTIKKFTQFVRRWVIAPTPPA
jgi:hypothetical protein